MNNRQTPYTTPDESAKLASDAVDEITCQKLIDEFKQCKEAGKLHKHHCKIVQKKMIDCVFRVFG
jgi:hypothetical protein